MRIVILLLLCVYSMEARPQVSFKTVVPAEPVIAGESFRVQFVAEGAESISRILPPAFSGFRFVNGPEEYSGLSATPGRKGILKNTVYTLLAVKPGRYRIPGAVALMDGKNYKSNDAWIEVIDRKVAEKFGRENSLADDYAAYALLPGEDPYEKIRQNLFVKVMLDKRSCYTGEPVVATFKLYSRLESRSEIVKNPGFYGFTVHDMINLSNKTVTTETVNGKLFDVHTIRQVQLYPLQAGLFTIDPMEINNQVEFSRSRVSKRTEQKIAEGAVNNDHFPSPGGELYESNIRTEPVYINVKAVPGKNRPESFTTAVGRFKITAAIDRPELAKNEQGQLIVTISGQGNFTQLEPPDIMWPEGIEGFDAVVTETLDKSVAPLKGQKTFRFRFVSSRPGEYKLPVVQFSFFDPATNNYTTLSGGALVIRVSNQEAEKTNPSPVISKKSISEINKKLSRIAAAIVIALVLVVLLYWLFRKKEMPVTDETIGQSKGPSFAPAEDVIQPAMQQLQADDKAFYGSLHKAIWEHLSLRFTLAGTAMNKQTLAARLHEVNYAFTRDLLDVLQHCEAGMFTGAVREENREELILKVKNLLAALPVVHSAYL